MLKITRHENDVNDIVLVFLLLTLNIFHSFFSASIVDFEQVNVCWVNMERWENSKETKVVLNF